MAKWIIGVAFALMLVMSPKAFALGADDGQIFSNIAATTASFHLDGGKYGVDCVATFGGGSVTLQKLSGDGSTYVTALTAFSAAGYSSADLAVGTYRILITTASAVYVQIQPVRY